MPFPTFFAEHSPGIKGQLGFQRSLQHLRVGMAMPARRYTDEQKEVIYETYDRGVSVRKAAAIAGVSADWGYRWVGQAGLSAKRRTPRQYSQSEKETFFERLAEVGDVSAVARELGFVRITCYKWAHRRGIFTSKFADAKR